MHYSDVHAFSLAEDGNGKKQLVATLESGEKIGLLQPEKLAGFTLDEGKLANILLKNNGLHIELQIDRGHRTGKQSNAGIKDVILEAATTVIQDGEDSIAAVDAKDKILEYRNITGLLKGDLTANVPQRPKDPDGIRRKNPDKHFTSPTGEDLTLPGCALMLFRNVGLAMYTDAVTVTKDGSPIPEGFLDAMITALAAKHDLAKPADADRKNSKKGSVYIVKPKMHGSDEATFTVALFEQVEEALGLPPLTLKLGIMDEEQRMSVNLKESIRAAQGRVYFINTGFLDRTGDLLHTAMRAGAMDTKSGIQSAPWKQAYEANNVQIGLSTGVSQIGKGMWAQNKNMAGLVEKKGAELTTGANTAWIPSDHGATLHAMH